MRYTREKRYGKCQMCGRFLTQGEYGNSKLELHSDRKTCYPCWAETTNECEKDKRDECTLKEIQDKYWLRKDNNE